MTDAGTLTIDVMRAWAARHGLLYREYEHWDETVREVIGIDSGGDQYTFYAHTLDSASGSAVVGATLRKRGNVKHHAFHRERLRFDYKQTVPCAAVESALDATLSKVMEWVREAGHDVSVGLRGAA
jgi:hypothetical protein